MVRKRRHIFPSTSLILVLVVYTLVQLKDAALAQEPNDTRKIAFIETNTSIDKNEVTIGDKIKFKVRVKYKDDITVKEIGPIDGPKREKDGYFIIERYYVLSSYEIGRATIPSLKIKYESVQGEGEIVTNEVTV